MNLGELIEELIKIKELKDGNENLDLSEFGEITLEKNDDVVFRGFNFDFKYVTSMEEFKKNNKDAYFEDKVLKLKKMLTPEQIEIIRESGRF